MEPVIYDMDSEEPSSLVLPRARRRLLDGGLLTNTVKPGALPSAVERYRKRASDLYDEGSKLMDSEPDMSQLQAFARQQGEQGNAAMLNALAAQYAGESFQPIQAQYLKRAAAAQEPMKVGGGMLTPDGQFIKDPMAARDKRAEFLLQQAKAYETLAQTAESKEQAAEAARLARESLESYRSVMAGVAQMNAQTSRLNAQTNQINAGAGADNRNDKKSDTLRNEYVKKSDKVREGTSHAQNVMQMLSDPTIAKDPTKQVSLIFSFGKMLDPDSVVRESEYSLIANARGLADRLQQIVPTIQTGARLTPAQLRSMAEVAQNLMAGANTRIDDLDNYYIDLAKRRGLNPEDVLPSYRKRQAAPQPAAGGSGGFSDPEKERRYQEWKKQQGGG